jgi:hypothetical protein
MLYIIFWLNLAISEHCFDNKVRVDLIHLREAYLPRTAAFVDFHRDNLSRHCHGRMQSISTTLINFSFNKKILDGDLRYGSIKGIKVEARTYSSQNKTQVTSTGFQNKIH